MKRQAFGERLRSLRNARGLSTYALAERSGVHRQQIMAYEAGRKKPMAATVEKLAAAFGVSVAELIGAISVSTSEAVDAYLRSSWSAAQRPTDDEVAWLRSVPELVFRGMDDAESAIAALIQWRRNNLKSR